MSIKIHLSKLNNIKKQQIFTDLNIYTEKRSLDTYQVYNDYVYLPYAYARNTFNLSIPKRKKYKDINNIIFNGTLREDQINIKNLALDYLNNDGSLIISCNPGFGKTIISIYLAILIKLKTLIIINKKILIEQWKESLINFCKNIDSDYQSKQDNIKIKILKPNEIFNIDDYDFFIINAINIPKINYHYFQFIGLIIIDEIHLILSETLITSLSCLAPKYLIGLSATPYRYDKLNILFNLYFDKKIYLELNQKHFIYKIETKIKLEKKVRPNGKLDWNFILNSQTNNQDRNEIIIKIIKKFKDNKILILSKRLNQCKYLINRLITENEIVSSLIENEKHYDINSRILIATTNKCSVGFDHPNINTLILACDVKNYLKQLIGRIFRSKHTIPVIFDLVDDDYNMQKHFNMRKEEYLKYGGTIKVINVNDL